MKSNWKRIICLVLVLLSFILLFSSCSSGGSSSSHAAGECMWCNGVGYSRFKDASGNWVNKTCSHCGGSGRSR